MTELKFDAGRVASLASQITSQETEVAKLKQVAADADAQWQHAKNRLMSLRTEFTHAVETKLDALVLKPRAGPEGR